MRCCFDDQEIDVDARSLVELVERTAMLSERFRQGFVGPDGRTLRERILVVIDEELREGGAEHATGIEPDAVVTFMHQLAGG